MLTVYKKGFFASKQGVSSAIMRKRRNRMHQYPITEAISYSVQNPENFTAMTIQSYMAATSLLFLGVPFKAAELVPKIGKQQREDLAEAVLSQPIHKTILQGLLPFRVVVDPEGSLHEAARQGLLLMSNRINIVNFTKAIVDAQNLALSIDPGKVKAICNLFQHELLSGYINLTMSHEAVKPIIIKNLASGEFPIVLPSDYKVDLDLLLEADDPAIRNIHALSFADPWAALERGAYKDFSALAIIGGGLAASESDLLEAGYDWRQLGVLPLLPRDEQPGYLLSMVSNLVGVPRGRKQLSHAIGLEPDAFKPAMQKLSVQSSEILVNSGIINHSHLELAGDAARVHMLERDLGM